MVEDTNSCAYTFSGSGGKNLGNFQVSLNLPSSSLTVTNQAALASITRSQGATVTWSGGFPNGIVQGQSSGGAPAVKFFCYAASSAGQLSVPASILLPCAGSWPDKRGQCDARADDICFGSRCGLAAAFGGGVKMATTFK